MTPEEFILKYYGIIHHAIRENLENERRLIRYSIENLLELIPEEYNWSHSSEGFKDWLRRIESEGLVASNIVNVITELWNRVERIDKESDDMYDLTYKLRHKRDNK